MKKLFAAGLVALAVLVAVPAAARVQASSSVSEPDVVVGTESWNAGSGYRVTVGFVPCGHMMYATDEFGNTILVLDPLGQYTAKIKKGGAFTVNIWAHSPVKLSNAMLSLYGFGLTQEAVDVLNEDAATYSCSA